jgi:D-serine deaminase-like pyridoxal phosphate-dependent protein
VIKRLSEEHCMLDLSRCASCPALGERVRIVPNHCCVVSNLHHEVSVVRDGELVGNWPVAARGRSR